MDIRYNIEDVAKYFLSKEQMTPQKLQKILYFSYSWYLAMMNEKENDINIKLFKEKLQAWISGASCLEIYLKYKEFGQSLIPKFNGELVYFTEDDKEILEEVWDVYGKFNNEELTSICRQHTPWKKTREENSCGSFDWCDKEIDDRLIFDYYAQQLVNE